MPCCRAVPDSRAVLDFITLSRSPKSHVNFTLRFKYVILFLSSSGCIPIVGKWTPA